MLAKKWSKKCSMLSKVHKKLNNGLNKKLRMQKIMQNKKYKIWKNLGKKWSKKPEKVSKQLNKT